MHSYNFHSFIKVINLLQNACHPVQRVPRLLLVQAVWLITIITVLLLLVHLAPQENTLMVRPRPHAQVLFHVISVLLMILLDCPTGCASCSSSGNCTTCSINYYYHSPTFQCLACPSGTYSEGGTASQCTRNILITLLVSTYYRMHTTLFNMSLVNILYRLCC